jgi:hypothetical protein
MKKQSLVAVLVVSLAGSLVGQQTVVIRSGNGIIGSQDSVITRFDVLAGGIATTFTAADFNSAQAGPPAEIPPPGGGWGTLANDPTAQWISTSQVVGAQQSGLFAAFFQIQVPITNGVTLDLDYLVDDYLGDTVNEGVFVNGTPLVGTASMQGGGWYIEQHVTGYDITALVQPGINWLYVYGQNGGVGGAGGICFSATIDVAGSVDLTELAPLQAGGVGLLQLEAQSTQAGYTYLIVPTLAPPVAPGMGLPLAQNTEFRLSLTDPLLLFTLNDPLAATFFVGTTGSISALNLTGWTLVSLPPDPGLIGTTLHWQAAVFVPATPGAEASNIVSTTVQ